MVTRSGVRNCALAAVLFGASTPAASVIAEDMKPLGAGRTALSRRGARRCRRGGSPSRPTVGALRRDWRRVAVAIVAGGAIGPALLTAGLVDTPAATASLLLNMELVATVVLAATLFREHLGRNMMLAALLVTAAGSHARLGARRRRSTPSALLIVGACVCWGLDNSVTSRIDQVSPQHVTFLKGVVAGSVNLVLGLAITGAGNVGGWSVVGALVVGALGYGASITLWVRGAQQLGAARGQVIFATAPFLGAVLVVDRARRLDRSRPGRRDAGRRGRRRGVAAIRPRARHTSIAPIDAHPRTRPRPTATTTTLTPTTSRAVTVTSTNTPRSCTRTRTCPTSTTDTVRRMRLPFTKTARTCSMQLMSSSGSPATARRSASLPIVIVPLRSATPQASAATDVFARRASAFVMPMAGNCSRRTARRRAACSS